MWGWISIALVTMLIVSFVAACGSDDDDDDASGESTTSSAATSDTGAAPTTAASDGDATEMTDDGDGIAATASAAIDAAATMTGMDSETLGAIGACFQENTTSEIVTDLRDGNTESAEAVYRTCLEGELPAEMVMMADPLIEVASECGVTSAEGLSDDDVTAMEGGDEAVIERVTTETVECLSAEFGGMLN
jgi:hypothetical protein